MTSNVIPSAESDRVIIDLLSSDDEEEGVSSDVMEGDRGETSSSSSTRNAAPQHVLNRQFLSSTQNQRENSKLLATTTKKETTETTTTTSATSTSTRTTHPFPYPSQPIPRTKMDLVKQCWACTVPLGDLYAFHAHPLWQAPCCCLCANAIAESQEKNQDCSEASSRHDKDDNNGCNDDDDDVCMGCANDDCDELVLCDDCNRGYCARCLAQAHGGGIEGWEFVHAEILQQSNHDAPWSCPACSPPAALTELVKIVEQQQQRQQDPLHRTEEQVWEELQRVHAAYQEALEILDSPERQHQQQNEIRSEIIQSNYFMKAEELQQTVEQEFTAWRDEWEAHAHRVQDHEAILQDEMQTRFNVDLAALYETGFGHEAPKVQNQIDPEWVQQANLALMQRDVQRQAVPAFTMALQEEDYQDVEVLVDSSEDEDNTHNHLAYPGAQYRQGFASVQPALPPEYIRQVQKAEEEAHPELKKCLKSTEDTDLAETQREELSAANQGLRADQRIIVQQRQRRRSDKKKVATKAKPHVNHNSVPANNKGGKHSKGPVVTSATAENSMDMSGAVDLDVINRTLVQTPHQVKTKKRATLVSVSNETPAKPRAKLLPVNSAIPAGRAAPTKKIRFDPAFLPHLDILKDHQIEGIKVIWDNFFTNKKPGGVILAHNMGLGKTLTALAFLATSMEQGLVQTAIITIPTNTIGGWKGEFRKWIGSCRRYSIYLEDLDEAKSDAKAEKVRRFMTDYQGPRILLVTHGLLDKVMDCALDVDVVIIDEAHLALKSRKKKYHALMKVRTPLRLGLTGTPIANNLIEYFNMISFIRPGFFGEQAEFERAFSQPIESATATDSSEQAKRESEEKSRELYTLLKPFVNRKNASELSKDLPPLQQVVLHIRPTRMQQRMYKSYNSMKGRNDVFKNFFRSFQSLAPINNHPGNILYGTDGLDDSDELKKDDRTKVRDWWATLRKRFDPEELRRIDSGNKFVLLLHILVEAELRNEKVLVFSGCMKTLDFIQDILQREDWGSHIPGLSRPDGLELGGWKSGEEYLRIDGSVTSIDRTRNVNEFETSEKTRVFLLSVRAAGIGITLTSASRVVIMDTDFNPAISLQAIYRSYRYGQEKPVFVYRFLTTGSMEEKIYARCVNKTGVAVRVIDSKTIKREFTSKEVADLQDVLNWVQCDKCNKWRALLHQDDADDLPEKWFCAMNSDPKNNTCSAPERDEVWYNDELAGKHQDNDAGNDENYKKDELDNPESDALLLKDPILQKLLNVSAENGTKIVCKHKLEQSLFSAKDLDESQSLSAATGANSVKHSCVGNIDDQKPESSSKYGTRYSPSKPGTRCQLDQTTETSAVSSNIQNEGTNTPTSNSTTISQPKQQLCSFSRDEEFDSNKSDLKQKDSLGGSMGRDPNCTSSEVSVDKGTPRCNEKKIGICIPVIKTPESLRDISESKDGRLQNSATNTKESRYSRPSSSSGNCDGNNKNDKDKCKEKKNHAIGESDNALKVPTKHTRSGRQSLPTSFFSREYYTPAKGTESQSTPRKKLTTPGLQDSTQQSLKRKAQSLKSEFGMEEDENDTPSILQHIKKEKSVYKSFKEETATGLGASSIDAIMIDSDDDDEALIGEPSTKKAKVINKTGCF